MLKKILKYDMMSVWRIWWIMAVSVLGISFLGALALRFFISMIEVDAMITFAIIALLLFILSAFTVFASIFITEVLVYLRFYKNFYTDEGYLTFTLPVSRKKLFLSKTLNAMIWSIVHIALILICIIIYMLIAPPTENGFIINPIAFEAVGEWMVSAWVDIGAWFIVYTVEIISIVLLFILFGISLVHFCITLGAVLAKKAKLIAAIGIYYLVNAVLSFVGQILLILALPSIVVGLAEILNGASDFISNFVISLVLLIACTIFAALASSMYFFTLDKIERKLNLA